MVLVLISSIALALPAPPADMPPAGSDPIDGGSTPTNSVPLLVFQGSVLSTDATVLETATGARQTPTIVDVGTFRTPAWELRGLTLTEGSYLIEGPNWSSTFNVTPGTAAAPVDPNTLANEASFVLPNGETGSGYGWGLDLPASDNSVFLYSDEDELLTVRAPGMSDVLFWFSSTGPDDGLCVTLETRAADGATSVSSSVLCSDGSTPGTDEPSGGCSVIGGSSGWGFVALMLVARRRLSVQSV